VERRTLVCPYTNLFYVLKKIFIVLSEKTLITERKEKRRRKEKISAT
jgi:hypothetical protein